MLTTILIILCLFLICALGVTVYYALRWARIIFLFEDDLDEAIQIHERTTALLEAIQKTPMFFDSKELQITVKETMDNVKICQLATQKLVNSLTQRSKQKYIRVIDQEEEEAN